MVLTRLKSATPGLGLEPELESELRCEIQTIESQLNSPKPKTGILKECFRSVRTILEGTTAAAAGQFIVEIGKFLL